MRFASLIGHPLLIKLRILHWMPREHGEHGFGGNEQTWCKNLKFFSYIPGAPMTSMCWRSIVNSAQTSTKTRVIWLPGNDKMWWRERLEAAFSFKSFPKEMSWMESLHNSTNKTNFGINTKSKSTFQLLPSVTSWENPNGGDQQPPDRFLLTPKKVTEGRTCDFFSPNKKNSDWISFNLQRNRLWTRNMFLKLHRSTSIPFKKCSAP